MNISKIALSGALLLSINGANAGGIESVMKEKFNSMINVTDPKAYKNAQRGVFSGGNIYVRNQITTTRLANVQMPSISAGCGGISIYGGAFSFINADQMIETFQAIGSNAIGYGLKLAIQNACNSCENVMTSLEKTAQFINKMNIDSCQAAQGIVNAGVDLATGNAAKVRSNVENSIDGVAEDFSQAWTWPETKGNTSEKQMKEDDPEKAAKILTGNVLWRALIDAKIKNVYSADEKYLELLMSMLGTVIFDFKEGDSVQPISYEGYKVTLKDLIDGGNIKIYKCNDTSGPDACLNVTAAGQEWEDEGLKQKIINYYTGSKGMINALANNKAWDDEAKSVLDIPSVITSSCNSAIRTEILRDKTNTGKATQLAVMCSSRMALDMSLSIVMSIFDSIQPLLNDAEKVSSNKAAKEQAQALIKAARERYIQEYDTLDKQSQVTSILMLIDSNRKLGKTFNGAQ